MAYQIKINDSGFDRLIKQAQGVRPRVVHDGVEYGVHQEFSTSPGGRSRPGGRSGTTGAGHPSLVPAFEQHTRGIAKLVEKALAAGVDLDGLMAKLALDIQADWAGDVNVDTGAYKNSITVSEGM